MLNYKKIKNFFKTYQTGYIGIVLPDCEFKLYSDVDYQYHNVGRWNDEIER